MAEGEKKQVIVSVEGNEHLPVIFQGKFPVINDKATRAALVAFTGLETMTSERGVRYIVAKKGKSWSWGWKGFRGEVKVVDALPRGTILTFEYRTGSHSKAYHTYVAAFVVAEGEGDVTLEDRTDGDDVVVHVKNLRLLQPAPEEDIARINALFANKYNAKPSKYDPVSFFYYQWVEKGLAQPPKPAPPPPTPPAEEGESEPFELAVAAPAPVPTVPTPVPTAVETPAPPAAPAPAAETEVETQALVEEARVELRKILAEAGYVVVKVFAFDLPSEYKGVTIEQYEEEGRVIERRRLAHNAVELSKIRGLRRKFYSYLSSCAFRTPLGWVLIADPPKELTETLDELKKLAGGEYTVLEIPIPQLWVREQAERARDRLAATLEEVAKALADEAISTALRRRLERRKKEIEAALSRLSLFLSSPR
ncbi:MAG: hypothetical protein QXS92_02805 [Thermofilum sp.]